MVIELHEKATNSEINEILNKAYKKHTFLNKEHTKILVSINETKLIRYLKRGLPLYVQEPIINIRSLNPDEQINVINIDFDEKQIKPLIVHLIPNVLLEITNEYYSMIKKYCNLNKHEIIWSSEPHLSMMIVNLNLNEAKKIIEESNIIYKIEDVPKGLISKIPKKNIDTTAKIPEKISDKIEKTTIYDSKM